MEEYFLFGGARYRPILDSPTVRSRRPMPQASGQWTHVPYGRNVFEDNTDLQTVWQVNLWIPADDYATFAGYYHRWASLQTPWGTQYARLASLDVGWVTQDNSWRGQATFEWA